jgi:hypothetical protein
MYLGYKALAIFFLFIVSCTGSILDSPIDFRSCSGRVTRQDLEQKGFTVTPDDHKGFIIMKDQVSLKILDNTVKGELYSETDEKLQLRSFLVVIDTTDANDLLRKFRSSHFVFSYPLTNDRELFHSRELSAIIIRSPNSSKATIKKFL